MSAIRNVNEIKSIYGKENIADYLRRESEKGNVMYADNEKADMLRLSVPLQLREATSTISLNKILPHSSSPVNPQNGKNKEKQKPNDE
jgi:hypothetical protein